MKEGQPRGFIKLLVVSSLVASSAACSPSATREASATETATLSNTPTSTETPKPTSTPTPSVTATPRPTSTPTPNWEATNVTGLERVVEGESIELFNVNVDNVVIVNPPGIKELVYGVIRGEDGSTRFLIENFDCEFRRLREEGRLGELRERLFTKAWDIGQTSFTRISVEKNTQIGEVALFTSQSFEFSGESEVCPEDPVLRPVTEGAKRILDYARNLVLELVEKLQD